MKIVDSFEKAVALGASDIFRDAEDVYRCYMPGEIVREVVEAEPAVTDAQVVEFLDKAGLLNQIQAAIEATKT